MLGQVEPGRHTLVIDEDAELTSSELRRHSRATVETTAFQLITASARDYAAISDADFGLHKTIIGVARHGRLLKQYELIEQQIRLYIHSSNTLIAESNEIVAQHEPIVEAILAGRSARAAKLSEQHNVDEGEKLVAFLNTCSRSQERK